ncbi:uncharacterized protein LOC143447473 [Clavelina lepadiformis]|uniref:uncharacterized protein LOC143447473 n=1 Tax=Clavelina lepadiformis TaxID=159417 RepID=UPI00404386B3
MWSGKIFMVANPGKRLFTTVEMEHKMQNYKYFLPIQTRWNDNDHYGHVNNSIYHFYVDTIVNNYLIWFCGLKTSNCPDKSVGYMVDTRCIYRKPLQYPQVLLGGLCISKIGKSSVHYQVAFFEPKLDYTKMCSDNPQNDPHLKLGLGSRGLLLDPSTASDFISEMVEHYHDKASVVGKSVHVFVDSKSQKPASKLNEHLLSGLQNVFAPCAVTKSHL